MERKLKRAILDLEDLAEEPYLNQSARERIESALDILRSTNAYSTEL